ncbi:unnamed protein product [Gadus morhua 'NCC']
MVRVHRSTACRVIRRVSLALSRRIARYVHLPNEEEAAAMKQWFRQASDTISHRQSPRKMCVKPLGLRTSLAE